MNIDSRFANGFSFDLKGRPSKHVRVFVSLHPYLHGALRLDSDVVRCVDPWTTAVKYISHMNARGWTISNVEHIKNLTVEKSTVIILTMEKRLCKSTAAS